MAADAARDARWRQIDVRVPESLAQSGQTPVFGSDRSNASNPVTVAVN
jgi:hypothetical protein